MDLTQLLNDERLLANLITAHVVLAVLLVLSMLLRKLFQHGGEQIARWTGQTWLEGVSLEASKSARALLFWTTVVLMIVSIGSMAVYHLSGRDARTDLRDWSGQLSIALVTELAIKLAKLIGLAIGVALAYRLIRRLRVFAETFVHHHLPRHVQPEPNPGADAGPDPHATSANAERAKLEMTIRRWFTLLERFAIGLVVISALWLAGHVLNLREVDYWVGLVLQIITYLIVARLLTLACHTIFHLFANLGTKQLDHGSFRRYWERMVRLFPLGERCFEGAVWVFAASRCINALVFIEKVEKNSDRIVQCIGIFFATRVVIELLQVFINELFGMYNEQRDEDQKGRTLVPLLQSLIKYVVYFGSALAMLHVFEVDTTPILAGAGVIGLAVGLGAQSFVSDLVSGFFILFEEQYFVGDIVEVGDAAGRVEAISIRNTQIRDENGKLFIIPNGQVKTVINYSKGYVNAVVDIKVPTSSNLDQVMRDMAEAGRRLRQRRREAIGDTVVKGLVDLTPNDMVIRAVTKVQPGANLKMQREYRKILKEVFDESSAGALKALAA